MAIIERRKSDILKDDDFLSQTPWRIDETAAHAVFRGFGEHKYDNINEILQNAFDSKRNPKTEDNEIHIQVPQNTRGWSGHKEILSIQDYGDGLTGNYRSGNINDFLQGKKGDSPKAGNLDFTGERGIGMEQYLAISQTVLFTSQDENCVYRIPLTLDANKHPTWLNWTYAKISPENQQEYFIFHKGTRVEFYDRYENDSQINLKRLHDSVQKNWAFKMAENPQIRVILNDKDIELRPLFQLHKPKWLARLKKRKMILRNGQTVEVSPDITGFIVPDKKGHGNIEVYRRGQFVGEFDFDAKRCSGAVQLNELEIDPSRKVVKKDAIWDEFSAKIIQLMAQFPNCGNEDDQIQDEKKKKFTLDLFRKALDPILPDLFTEGTSKKKETAKTLQTGAVNGIDDLVPGYPAPNEEPEEKGGGGTGGGTRDPKHIMFVSTKGTQRVMRADSAKEGRRKHEGISIQEQDMEPDAGFIHIYRGTGLIVINKKDPVYTYSFECKSMQMAHRLVPHFANIFMLVKHPDAASEMTTNEIVNLQTKYMADMLRRLELD